MNNRYQTYKDKRIPIQIHGERPALSTLDKDINLSNSHIKIEQKRRETPIRMRRRFQKVKQDMIDKLTERSNIAQSKEIGTEEKPLKVAGITGLPKENDYTLER